MGSFTFKRKNFTIPEGHFTGQKDMEEVPSLLHDAGKGLLYGAGIGAVGGGAIGYFKDDSTLKGGAMTGAKYGAIAGIASGVALKFFQNYMHKPMKSIKFQEVDRGIRRQFGTYRMAGISVGDSIDKRMTMDEKFSFNDRQVDHYKINIAIQNDSLTMYTFGMSDHELDMCSKILDFYTQKYYGVNYSSHLINRALNSYSVDITFTNYNVIVNFIMELSQRLNIRINLMNEKAIVFYRLSEASNNPSLQAGLTQQSSGAGMAESRENSIDPYAYPDPAANPNPYGGYNGYNPDPQRNFSTPELSKSDTAKILGGTGTFLLGELATGGRALKTAGSGAFMMALLKPALSRLTTVEMVKYGLKKGVRSDYGNAYLEQTLKNLHYAEKFNYTVGDKTAPDNVALITGRLIVTVPKGSDSVEKIDKAFYNPNKMKINRADTGDTVVYSYVMDSTKEFEFMVNKLFSTKIRFNIFV